MAEKLITFGLNNLHYQKRFLGRECLALRDE